ncbi:hypothetical protein SASPL_118483 [Salvia splendens]|uniref:Reverse transcriptase domain-containing protein n=1 Tax=Salvia splendens TaxID=180675 RepID=A0A8X8Y1Q4_SALSN|nr:hypothetical protein SASPL_118483 [Salvia splendens]
MAIKVDLEKAYDRIWWEFVEDSLKDLELPQQIIRIIMKCVSTTTMQISWNRALTEEFRPEKVIIQGDPHSPYLFVIGMERLSHTINKAVDEGRWKPLRLSRDRSPISHLFFADDLVLFSRADCSNAKAIKELLDQFSQYSGHRVSINKTQLYFSPNTDADTAREIESIFHFKVVDNLGMYLGIPLLHGRVTGANFMYITDKVQRRLNRWSAASLSMARRVTLAKAILSAIPTYCMQVVRLHANVIDEIEKLIRRFEWGGSEQQTKLCLVNWKTVCRPIRLGIHDLKTHNQEFMIKLGFHLVSKDKSLWARILREKYKVNSACLAVIKRSSSSFVWRSLSRIWDHVCNNICWSIGDGVRTNFWYDTWIPSLGPLVAHKVNDLPAVVDASISNMVNHVGEWDWPNFQDLLSHGTCCKIASTCPHAAEAGSDVCTWSWASNGKFSVRGAYDLLSVDTITYTK